MCLMLQHREGWNLAQVVFFHPGGCVGQIRTKPKLSPAAAGGSSGFFRPRGFPVIQKCFLSSKNPGQGLRSRKSDLQGDPTLDKRHPVPASCSPRDGAQEGAEPAQLLLTQNKDFTWKKAEFSKRTQPSKIFHKKQSQIFSILVDRC